MTGLPEKQRLRYMKKMPNLVQTMNGRLVMCLLCLSVSFTSHQASADNGSLVFGNVTKEKGGRVYITVNQTGGDTLDVTCILPPTSLHNSTPYFTIGDELYDGNRSEVTVLNKMTARLVVTFYSPRPHSLLHCMPDGHSVTLFVNRGLEPANQYASCIIHLPPVHASSLNASVSLICDLTIIFGIEDSYFTYNVTIGTSRDDEELVLSANAQVMPIRLIYEKLKIADVLNSSMLFVRTSLAEQFSGRRKVLFTEVSIVDILQPPLDLLSWDPLDNGTGIRVFLNSSYLNQKCDTWKYHADIIFESAEDVHDNSTKWNMRCTLCNSTCQAIFNGLIPATTYPVKLWQRIVTSVDLAEHPQNTYQLPALLLNVTTADLAPLTGPEIVADVVKCSNETATCKEFPKDVPCFVVKISWKPYTPESLRGRLTGYTVLEKRGNTSNQTLVYSLPPNVTQAPYICWNGDIELYVSVAGKTSNGLSPFRMWDSSLRNTTLPSSFTSPFTSEHEQWVSAPVVASVLAAAGVIPIALTVICIKFAQYRKSWKSNRLRIPRIAPSSSSLIVKSHENDARSTYLKLSSASSEDLNKLLVSSSDCSHIPDRQKPSKIHGVRRSLSYTNFLSHQTYHMDTSEGGDAVKLMEGGRQSSVYRSHGTRSAEQLIYYLTNVSELSVGTCTTNCISPRSLQLLMVTSTDEPDAASLSSAWFETSNKSSAVFSSYPLGQSRAQSLSILDRICGPHVATSYYRKDDSLCSNESAAWSANDSQLSRRRSSDHLTCHDETTEGQCREKLQDCANFLTDSSGDYIRTSVLPNEHTTKNVVTTFTNLSPESDYIVAI